VRQRALESLQIGGGESDVAGGDVGSEPVEVAGAGDGHDVVALGEQPGQSELAGGDVQAVRDLAQGCDLAQVVLKVGARETARRTGSGWRGRSPGAATWS